MAEKRREIWFAEWDSVRKRGADAFLAYQQLSAGYAMMAVRSSLLLNGGAMFAGLAFMGALARDGNENPFSVGFIVASACFVLGIISAASSALAAYFNYQSFSQAAIFDSDQKALKKCIEFFPGDYSDIQEAVDHDNAFWDEQISKSQDEISLTFKIGVGAGVTSYIFFMIGCIVVGGTMATA